MNLNHIKIKKFIFYFKNKWIYFYLIRFFNTDYTNETSIEQDLKANIQQNHILFDKLILYVQTLPNSDTILAIIYKIKKQFDELLINVDLRDFIQINKNLSIIDGLYQQYQNEEKKLTQHVKYRAGFLKSILLPIFTGILAVQAPVLDYVVDDYNIASPFNPMPLNNPIYDSNGYILTPGPGDIFYDAQGKIQYKSPIIKTYMENEAKKMLLREYYYHDYGLLTKDEIETLVNYDADTIQHRNILYKFYRNSFTEDETQHLIHSPNETHDNILKEIFYKKDTNLKKETEKMMLHDFYKKEENSEEEIKRILKLSEGKDQMVQEIINRYLNEIAIDLFQKDDPKSIYKYSLLIDIPKQPDSTDNELTTLIINNESIISIKKFINDLTNYKALEMVNHVNKMGQSALHHAALLKDPTIYIFLSTYGDKTIKDYLGLTPEDYKNL